MADLVAGFGSSHSPMIAARLGDWLGGAFLPRDRARQLVDLDGHECRYDDALVRAPADAMERIAPDRLTERHATVEESLIRLRQSVTDARLDALIVVGDDQEELFDHTNMPAIGIFYGPSIRNARATPSTDPLTIARMRFQEEGGDADYPCDAALAGHLIESLQADGFDLSVMKQLPPDRFEGHAYSFVHRFCMAGPPIPIVPIFLNAYYPPNQPSPARCHELGRAIGRAVVSYRQRARVGIIASGGLSHFLVDEPFDLAIIDALRRKDDAFFRDAPLHKLKSGSSEIRNWICLAGALGSMQLDWVSYVPGYRTPALTGTGLCFASFR